MTEHKLHKQVAVVTGASSGIGYETAILLQTAGYTVYGLSLILADNGPFMQIQCDITCEAGLQAAMAQVLGQEGRLDLLICNAGFGISGATEFTETAQAEKQFAVNFFGAFDCIKNALPALRQSKGRIITVSSLAAVLPIPFQAFYSASKAALIALTLALADEVKPFGIQAAAVMPGDVQTNFTAAREKQDAGAQHYGAVIGRSVSTMEHDEQNGMGAAYVARHIVRIALRRRMPPIYVIGLQYRLFYILQKFLPLRLVRFIVGKMYA